MDQSKKKFLKNMVGFSMMTWISFLLGFISSPIATRLFVPEELAKFNMFSTYGSLIASVCYLGLDQAYVRFFREPPGKSTRKSLYTFCTLVPLAFSLVAALVLPVHCQLAISGRSTPCAAMYCRCSTSLSRICCTV